MPESESGNAFGLKTILVVVAVFMLGGYLSVRTAFLSSFFGGLSPIAMGTRAAIERLERARSEAEGRCGIAQLVLARRGDARTEMEGRKLYLAAKTEADVVVASFSATMLCGIDEKELTTLQDLAKTAAERAKSFL
ncbi:hypothetical protein, partial [Paludisphaera rhizosphaerae]|uniref:hypothetical protein n=1 Tax=Paludisphaera rhizosphaerae TaxID=2711216 RepID=UPI0013ECEE12